jgi:hypothetical protein
MPLTWGESLLKAALKHEISTQAVRFIKFPNLTHILQTLVMIIVAVNSFNIEVSSSPSLNTELFGGNKDL